jgi:RNA recognition motif-containing protein
MATNGAEKDNRTLFVRGISFDVNEKELEGVFSDLGPIKQCFLIKEKDQPKHKGFGFVQYALEEDAVRAVTEFNGRSVGGRKLQVRHLPAKLLANCFIEIVLWFAGGVGQQARPNGGTQEETARRRRTQQRGAFS